VRRRPIEPSILAALRLRLESLACVQPFGWMLGCVLDGLLDWGDTVTARRQLGLFIDASGGLVCENSHSQPVDGGFVGNWGRAYVWHALGLARSLVELGRTGLWRPTEEHLIRDELVRTLERALMFRSPEGLWTCFVNEPETGVDTSASAGIAAASAIAQRSGLIGNEDTAGRRETVRSLLSYVTPDGLLTGTAPLNRNGEGFQRSGYRIISQMSMGLTAQLLAAGKE
jgi:rhamnogalacturonyl hydrolase YesR